MRKISTKTFLFLLGLLMAFNASLHAQTPVPASALDFDGTNDYVNVSNFGTAPSSFTIEAWFKQEGGFGHQNIVGWLGNRNGRSQQILVGTQPNGTLRFGNFDYSSFSFVQLNGTTNVRDGQWHHLAIVTDGNNLSLIVDGQLQDTDVAPANNTVEDFVQYIRIGAQGIDGLEQPLEYFNGKIDEVRIWSVALTPADVQAKMSCQLKGNEENLLAYYNFNQGFVGADNSSETTLIDRTSNGKNGILNNFSLNGVNSNWSVSTPLLAASCISDMDEDGIADDVDNCPTTANPDQADADCDGVGDVCDVCPGGDDKVDNNNDGVPDCSQLLDYAAYSDAWKCGDNKIMVLHMPSGNPGNVQNICISYNALPAHLAHGDKVGVAAVCATTNPIASDNRILEQPVSTKFGFEVFPNPASSEAKLLLTGVIGKATITVRDQLGRVVATQQVINDQSVVQLGLSDKKLTTGTYYVTIVTADNRMTKKLAIVK